jgi:hypothetical protein
VAIGAVHGPGAGRGRPPRARFPRWGPTRGSEGSDGMSIREAMIRSTARGAILLLTGLASAPARAQEPAAEPLPQPHAGHPPAPRTGKDAGQMPHVHPTSAKAAKMLHMHHEGATGMLGPYPVMREASGTLSTASSGRRPRACSSRQRPDHDGSTTSGSVPWDDRAPLRRRWEALRRGRMLMGRSHGPIGPGTLDSASTMSGEPESIGKQGLPAPHPDRKSADGVTPLIDRQHPHDLFMELATTFSVSPDPTSSIFVYAGCRARLAGPPVFVHASPAKCFDAPISHHWLDSTPHHLRRAHRGVDRRSVEGRGLALPRPQTGRGTAPTSKAGSQIHRILPALSNRPPDLLGPGSYGRLHSPRTLEPDVDGDPDPPPRRSLNHLEERPPGAGHGRSGCNRKRPGKQARCVPDGNHSAILAHHLADASSRSRRAFPPGDPRAGTVYEVEDCRRTHRGRVAARARTAFAIGGLASLAPSGRAGCRTGRTRSRGWCSCGRCCGDRSRALRRDR